MKWDKLQKIVYNMSKEQKLVVYNMSMGLQNIIVKNMSKELKNNFV